MKKYQTIELHPWKKLSVYMYDYKNRKEIIIEDMTVTEKIAELNNEGYFVSATYKTMNNIVFMMTKEIDN